IFHFGQIILHSIGLGAYVIDAKIRANVIEIMPERIVLKSILYCTISIFLFHSGALLYALKQKRYPIKEIAGAEKIGESKQFLLTRGIGILMLIVSIYPMIKFDSGYIRAALNGGYTAVYQLDINTGLWDDLSRMYKPSILFLLVSFKKKPTLARIMVVINILYSLVKLSIIGQRGYEMIFIVVLVWLYIKIFSKLDFKRFLTLSVFSMVVTSILSLAVANRDSTSRFDLSDVLNYLLTQNPILQSISEFGGTLYTVELYIDLIPRTLNFGFGSSYLASLLTLLPNVNGILGDSVKLASPNYLLSLEVTGIGGSYIGEFYYNFGWYGVVLGLIFGYLFASFSNSTQRAFNQNKFFVIAASATFLNIVLWTIRDSFTAIPRNLLFQLVIPYVLFILLYKLVKKA
ncbi:O-antigen polysaccharide polymerase Wzy, partial [Neobacillus drentensis]|uniref:O-antigen polysaccharide polymerase Wzy n=1 Tax=Neobacillus drentensis TaxID=220684 RepID=UPI002FFE3534